MIEYCDTVIWFYWVSDLNSSTTGSYAFHFCDCCQCSCVLAFILFFYFYFLMCIQFEFCLICIPHCSIISSPHPLCLLQWQASSFHSQNKWRADSSHRSAAVHRLERGCIMYVVRSTQHQMTHRELRACHYIHKHTNTHTHRLIGQHKCVGECTCALI